MHHSAMKMITGRKELNKFIQKLIVLFIGLFVLIGFDTVSLKAEKADESLNSELAFSDLNGDGIHDNSLDTDNDGLSDFNSGKFDGKSGQDDLSLFSFDISEPTLIEDLLTREEKFKRRQFRARAHTQNRGEFGSTSSGPGSGVGVAIGGACVGGVCFY
jgi:hypothetical protein